MDKKLTGLGSHVPGALIKGMLEARSASGTPAGWVLVLDPGRVVILPLDLDRK
jgi:hypothetical protein